MATKATLAAFESQSNPSGIANILNKILKEDTLKNLQNGKKKFEDYDIPGADMDSFIKKFNSYEGKEDDLEILQIHRTFVDKVLASFEQVNENTDNENEWKDLFFMQCSFFLLIGSKRCFDQRSFAWTSRTRGGVCR